MELIIKHPQIKSISFEDYERYFLEALKQADGPNFHILFYRKLPEGIEISFSWDNFIILCLVPYSKIVELYKDQNLNVSDVTLSDKTDHPFLIKFFSDYLLNRGIPSN